MGSDRKSPDIYRQLEGAPHSDLTDDDIVWRATDELSDIRNWREPDAVQILTALIQHGQV